MRLIDADKLTKRFKQLKGVDSLANMFITDVVKEIQGQPTVEAVPVVHGEWIVGSKPRCSVCGKSALREFDREDWLSHVPSDFCPHCGADMRKKV